MLGNDAVPGPQAALADAIGRATGDTNVTGMLPLELDRIALTESDVTNLAAFLRAPNEDYD